ncbi:MAG: GNAT family N-acetyltransferase [Lachnospiraceae bacterium]|nr:GNAT family N-acetyltransferase [Lachnospiraceae bacterium]
MYIRKTTKNDLPVVNDIYKQARDFMCLNGNPTQWTCGYPQPELLEFDIKKGSSYVCVEKEKIQGVFYFAVVQDPTYAVIDGAWLHDAPYGVVHRIAVASGSKGVGAFCLNWCLAQCGNVRIDTHVDNVPMLNLLKKLGFIKCGIIWVLNGKEERIAFQKCKKR